MNLNILRFRSMRGGHAMMGLLMLASLFLAGLGYYFLDQLPEPPSPTLGSQMTVMEQAAAKLYVLDEGVYRITSNELAEAGMVTGEPARFRLTHRGQSRPLWHEMDHNGYSLFFYGEPSESRYSPEAVYWLELVDEPLLFEDQAIHASGDYQAVEDSSQATFRVEQNNHYTPQSRQAAPWYWLSLPAPQQKEVEFDLMHLKTGGSAWIAVQFWASTDSPASPDHHVRISVNGQVALDESWDGKGLRLLEAELAPGTLINGVNTFVIEAPGDTSAAADIVWLDWIEVSYERFLEAVNGRLEFSSRGAAQKLMGFDGAVSLYDITDPRMPVRAATLSAIDESVLLFPGQMGHRYLAVGRDGHRQLTRIVPVSSSILLNESLIDTDNGELSGGDYVVVGPSELLAPLQPLLEWRASQGLKTVAVPLQTIYDQFNHGYPEPSAVQQFLQYAALNWQPAPRYLLLVGDATYDTYGYQSAVAPGLLPSFFIQSEHGGETASDVLFGELDGDGIPDLAVGRVPARDPLQVQIWVEKTLNYEQQADLMEANPAWQRRVLAIADGQEAIFNIEAQAFLDSFPEPYEQILLTPSAGESDASRDILSYLENGVLFAAYFGHGSLDRWGKDRLFTSDDVLSLKNGQNLPVVLNFTCLTGLFTHPKQQSLAEHFLWQPRAGAAALIAPTGLTLPADQSILARTLATVYLENPQQRLGDMYLAAQRQMPVSLTGSRDVLFTFLLFGDPGLVLK